jgi:hypothetical protein
MTPHIMPPSQQILSSSEPPHPILVKLATTPLVLDRDISVTALGLHFQRHPDFEDWSALGIQMARALRCMEFVIGDWLVYGDENFRRKGPGRPTNCNYEEAIRTTGLDVAILRDYAYVSRHVHMSRRTDKLSWTHHRLVAKLPPEKQRHWLELAAKHPERISVKRLRKSINADRLVSIEELTTLPGNRAIITHIPPINRLGQWWNSSGGRDWLRSQSNAELHAMLLDFKPIVDIVKALKSEFEMRPKGH